MSKKAKKSPTPKRKFTDNFAKGDRVSVIREEHGWHDGALEGRITSISDYSCQVTSDDGGVYNIPKPKDIRKIMPW